MSMPWLSCLHSAISQDCKCERIQLFSTARKGNVSTGVCQSFCSQLASWLLGHCPSFLWHGRYASYWNAFLFTKNFSHDLFRQNFLKKEKLPPSCKTVSNFSQRCRVPSNFLTKGKSRNCSCHVWCEMFNCI